MHKLVLLVHVHLYYNVKLTVIKGEFSRYLQPLFNNITFIAEEKLV
jgi:hypothetical protein